MFWGAGIEFKGENRVNFFDKLAQFLARFRFWVTVEPWEQALRIRMGKHVRKLSPGVFFIFPFMDVVYSQTIRRRASGLTRQTLVSKDRQTVTVSGAINYRIDDLEKLFQTLHHPESTIQQFAKAAIAEYISETDANHLHLKKIKEIVTRSIDFEMYGLADVEIMINEIVIAKTYRLVGDQDYGGGTPYDERLNMESRKT